MIVAATNDSAFIGMSAKQMARDLLTAEFRGPGDTIEAAAFRLERAQGCEAEIILQGWRRDIHEMKASRWLKLFRAWWEVTGRKSQELYAAERENHDPNSWVVGLADFVAGRKDGGRD